MQHESIFGGGSLQLRQMPEQHHGRLKTVRFKGFNSAKSLVELTCYILRNAKSLGWLTLDNTYGDPKCDSAMSGGGCTHIEDEVPSTVRARVVEHCTQCHADNLSE